MFDEYKLDLNIICIDFKSFYATVECAERGLDPLSTPLVVSDESRGNGAITLAVTPYLREFYGVKSRSRMFEIPKNIEGLIIAKPQMAKYVEKSKQIIELYLNYFDRNDIYIYSIDEVFIDVTKYLKLYKCTDYELAVKLMKKILNEHHLYTTCGIGPNMLLAKYALDIESKHNEDWIAKWSYDDVEKKLWEITDLSSIWGIGRSMTKNLREDGVYKAKDIVELGVDFLTDKYGIMGEELFLHMHGIDISRIQDQPKVAKRKSYGIGQTLFEDYYDSDVLTILMEMAYDESLKLVDDKLGCKVVAISLGYSKDSFRKGASKQMKMLNVTNDYRKIMSIVKKLFFELYEPSTPVRKLSVTLSGLSNIEFEQLSLFDNNNRDSNKLDEAVVKLRKKYGKNAVLLSISADEKSTIKFRNTLIGGHNA